MKRIYVNNYLALGLILLFAVGLTALLVKTIHTISKETPQAFALQQALTD